jgi:hypothetical protein
MLPGGRAAERATRRVLSEERMGTGFIKHKPKKSDAKRAERSVPQPKAKPAAADKVKRASKPPRSNPARLAELPTAHARGATPMDSVIAALVALAGKRGWSVEERNEEDAAVQLDAGASLYLSRRSENAEYSVAVSVACPDLRNTPDELASAIASALRIAAAKIETI